jgi:2,4-dienoyl-CoA reductase-like NADH-dependent reductase (Old Yellow Enzyme family)
MLLETYQAVRAKVGKDFPIWVKINVTDGFDQGISPEDVLYLTKELTKAGIDAIEISGAFLNFPDDATSFFKNEAEAIAKENDVPVILTGGNKKFEEMTQILNSTKISYFGLGRSICENPNIVNEFKQNLK